MHFLQKNLPDFDIVVEQVPVAAQELDVGVHFVVAVDTAAVALVDIEVVVDTRTHFDYTKRK